MAGVLAVSERIEAAIHSLARNHVVTIERNSYSGEWVIRLNHKLLDEDSSFRGETLLGALESSVASVVD